MMPSSRSVYWLAVILLGAGLVPAQAGEPFPFGSELMLDTAPMYGSKRIPMLNIDDDGATSIDLWCGSVRGQATVGGDGSITIVPGQSAPAQCAPERQTVDETLLAALTQATTWRRSGEVIELSGVTTLRFRLMTN
jgi:hypothetical protein